jgi:transcription elongation factor Elf1
MREELVEKVFRSIRRSAHLEDRREYDAEMLAKMYVLTRDESLVLHKKIQEVFMPKPKQTNSEAIRKSVERKRVGKTRSFYCALCTHTASIVDVEVLRDEELHTKWKRVYLECATCEDSISQTIDVPYDRYTKVTSYARGRTRRKETR